MDFSENDIVSLEKQLEEFEGDTLVQNALKHEADIAECSKLIEGELREVEKDSIQDYVQESDNLTALHADIRACDDILEQLETMLSGFQHSLGNISSEIKNLQEESMSMNIKLKNRREAEKKLCEFTDQAVLPEDLFRGIEQDEVSDAYLDYLKELDKKIAFTKLPSTKSTASHPLIEQSVSALKNKAVFKVSQFLKSKIEVLKKPKTNFQILQQNVLLKFKYFMVFLYQHAPHAYQEVRELYMNTMSRAYYNVFRVYHHDLSKLSHEVATKNDMIGNEESQSKSLFGRAFNVGPTASRGGVFSLGDRGKYLENLDDHPIISHVALEAGQVFPFEEIYRSMTHLLMDSTSTEYLFYTEFFGIREDMFEQIFGPTIQTFFIEKLDAYLRNCFDAIGVLLMIRVTYEHQRSMQKRRIPCLDNFHDQVNMLLWPRFKAIFDLNVSSIANAKGTVPERDKQAHYITRRYVEFATSILLLNQKYKDDTINLNLRQLRMQMDKLLMRQAGHVGKDAKTKAIFLINNYDLILTVFGEKGIKSDDTIFFDELLEAQSTCFIEEELQHYFGGLIVVVKELEPMVQSRKPQQVDLSKMEALVKDFASKWQTAVDDWNANVLQSFSNFKLGMELLKKIITQLLLYYARFLDVLKKTARNASFMKDVVSPDTIIMEIRQKVKIQL
eukprot:Rmarinus@m.14902